MKAARCSQPSNPVDWLLRCQVVGVFGVSYEGSEVLPAIEPCRFLGFEGLRAFGVWLFSCGRRTATDHRKKAKLSTIKSLNPYLPRHRRGSCARARRSGRRRNFLSFAFPAIIHNNILDVPGQGSNVQGLRFGF
jgi:hypothetical protein